MNKKSPCIDCGKLCTFTAKRCNSCARKGILNNNYKEIKMSKKEIDKRQLIKRPWLWSYKNAKQRCNNPNNQRYKDYGGRGIKFKLTEEECDYLWNRDKAWSLYQPSIDRINNDGNYTLWNCHFIEMPINAGKDKKKTVLQYDLEGDFIQEWDSILEASKTLDIDNSNIAKVSKGKIKTAGGFKWRIKE